MYLLLWTVAVVVAVVVVVVVVVNETLKSLFLPLRGFFLLFQGRDVGQL